MGLAKQATGRTDYGLYLMAAAMILGALLVQLLPRNASIDEAGHAAGAEGRRCGRGDVTGARHHLMLPEIAGVVETVGLKFGALLRDVGQGCRAEDLLGDVLDA